MRRRLLSVSCSFRALARFLLLAVHAFLLLADFHLPVFAQSQSAERHYQKGIALLGGKKYDEAIAAFSAALKLQPKHEPAYQKRVETYQKEIIALNGAGQYEEALSLIQAALENSICFDDAKNRSWFFKLRGNGFFRLGDYVQALAAYQQSVEAVLVTLIAPFYLLNEYSRYREQREIKNALSRKFFFERMPLITKGMSLRIKLRRTAYSEARQIAPPSRKECFVIKSQKPSRKGVP